MTQPRLILPGDELFVTQRTIARFYLLRPDPELVSAIKYCLAHYAEKHGVRLYAVCVLSTHYHLVVKDPHANCPLFLRDANRGIANVVKALRGWRGPVFSPTPNVVRLQTRDALVDKIGYTLANPVAAAAVKRHEDWPGLCSAGGIFGQRPTSVARPKLFFASKSRLPSTVSFELHVPDCLVDWLGDTLARKFLQSRVARHERRGRELVEKLGWKVKGPQLCLRLNPRRRAKSREVFGGRVPTFATSGGGLAAHLAATAELREFRMRYRWALGEWRKGDRTVSFPPGTWMMRVMHAARCHTRADPPVHFSLAS